jgi:hypothetical protein
MAGGFRKPQIAPLGVKFWIVGAETRIGCRLMPDSISGHLQHKVLLPCKPL